MNKVLKMVCLDAATMGNCSFEPIARLGELVLYPNSTKEETLIRIKDCDVAIANKIIFDEDLIESAPNLKLIAILATGVNNVDLQAAARHNVAVRNVVSYSTEAVAQATFMHILSLAGQARYLDDYVKSGAYSRSDIFCDPTHPAIELTGRTLGIIGLGNIGKRVAQIATAFGMKVVYYSTSGRNACDDYTRVSLEELLAMSDIVSVHAPLNDATKGLIGAKELSLMKATAFIINVGRGGIIDEAALVEAVDNAQITGAGIDVFTVEPMAADSPFMRAKHPERFSFSPHMAWCSDKSVDRLIARVANNIKTFFEL